MSSRKLIFVILIVLLSISGCARQSTPSPLVPTPTTEPGPPRPMASDTPAQPTATPEPLAATVNGQGITLAEYLAELARYKAGLAESGQTPPAEDEQKQAAIGNLIDDTLLAQGALEAGFTVSAEVTQQRYDRLAADLGGMDKLQAYQQANGFSDTMFKDALARGIAAAWQRDQLVQQAPASAEQVRARQILAYSEADAQAVLQRLNTGADFATIARIYDPISDGDLGWFPRGYLLTPEVEQAAFALQPGQRSEIIKSHAGYHIIEVLERDPNRPLSTDARLALQSAVIRQWLEQRRAAANITLTLP